MRYSVRPYFTAVAFALAGLIPTSLLRSQPIGGAVPWALAGGVGPTGPAAAPPGANASRPVGRGMRFKRYTIKDDPTYTGMEISSGIMPADWNIKGGVVWDVTDAFPAQFRMHFSDPNDVAAFDYYPSLLFFWSARAATMRLAPEYRYLGQRVAPPPADQFDAMMKITVPMYRPDLANAKVVSKVKSPEVAKAVFEGMFKAPGYEYTVYAGKMTFEYDLKGQTVQEEMTMVYKKGIKREFNSSNWEISNVTSTRSIKGKLDDLAIVRTIMVKSCQPNPAWYNKVSQFIMARQKATMEQLKNQEERQKIFLKMHNEVTEENKRWFEGHMADIDRGSEKSADTMREVSPWETPGGGRIKLPTKYGRAWAGSNGEIYMDNDPLYDPNADPNNTHITWTPMQQSR